ncbi:MAG: hypothetical protein H6Q18_185 [Bacteroidetes bacterium]|nr:hypothetical protein [Bacteroidota bacterium]
MKTLKMKTFFSSLFLLLLTIAAILTCNSCKKEMAEPIIEEKVPTNFAEIQLGHIMALEPQMSNIKITVSDANNLNWKTGDVFVYKTSEGRYGKFEVVKIDPADNFKLTLKITNYANDGSVFLGTSSLDIRGTYLCDLDIVAETSNLTLIDDFHWNRLTSTNTSFEPKNGAKFVKYVFKT